MVDDDWDSRLTFNFMFNKILKFCGTILILEDEITYLSFVLCQYELKYINSHSNRKIDPSFEKNIKSIIKYKLTKLKMRIIKNREANNKKKISKANKNAAGVNPKIIDQDTKYEKFIQGCKKRNLQKGKTIPVKCLFEIAKECGLNARSLTDFKPGNRAYQEAREYASRSKYKRRKENPNTKLYEF